MRLTWVLVILLVPFSQAVTWEDARGDQEMGRRVADGDGAPPPQWFATDGHGWYRHADVVSASISETASDLVFEVELQSRTGQAPPTFPEFERMRYLWQMEYHGEEVWAGFETWNRDIVIFAMYEMYETGFGTWLLYRFAWLADVREDAPGFRAEIPKWLWRDREEVPIREGDRLERLRFAATDAEFFHYDRIPCPHTNPPQAFSFQCGWRLRDEMQGGAVLGDFEVKMSPPGVGHLFFRIEKPIRQSNGLATTYVFETKVHNLEDGPDTFFTQVADVPDGWEVHLPPTISFDGKGAKMLPVAVTVPFVHKHGEQNFLELTMVSGRNASASMSSAFGVVFADPPQPAGHHDTLYFHTDGDWWSWMNTLKDDPEGAHGAVRPGDVAYGLDELRASWTIGMNPPLDIGLDFDIGRPVTTRFGLEMPQDGPADVHVRLLLVEWRSDERILLAEARIDDVMFRQGAAVDVDAELAVVAAADRVPPMRGHNLVLEVNVSASTQVPLLWFGGDLGLHTQDAFLRLPLFDYHDEVDLSGLEQLAFRVEAINGTRLHVNPGRTAAAAFNVTNLLDQRVTLEWELRGQQRFVDWAEVMTPTTRLKAGGTGTVIVRYQPPVEAQEGDTAALILIGRAKEDPSRQVFARLSFFIETDEDIPDAAQWAQQLHGEAKRQDGKDQQSPVPAALLLMGLALAAVGRRRRPG